MFSQKGRSTPTNVPEKNIRKITVKKSIAIFVAGQPGFECKVEKPTENGKLFYENRIRWCRENSWQEISIAVLSRQIKIKIKAVQ